MSSLEVWKLFEARRKLADLFTSISLGVCWVALYPQKGI